MKSKKYISLSEDLKVLVVGNNPIELGRVFDSLNRIPGKKIITEIAFDVATILDRLAKFTPHFILIDDNIGKLELRNSVRTLLRSRKTKGVPITVLKNSNYHEAINSGVLDYILKENLTGGIALQTFMNSIKFRDTQQYLHNAYRKRKGQLMRLIR